MADVDIEPDALMRCAMTSLVGERLGSGATRRVYAMRHNPELVIKFEFASREFCNVAEWDVWQNAKNTANAKWFAPCVDIDVWGGVLIMRRTQPITEEEFRAEVKKVPEFMGDTHWANFGRLDGKIVCHDYGYHRLMNALCMRPKMVAPRYT